MAPIARKVDKYDRAIFTDSETPDPWTPESRFAQWRGKTCGPWTVINVHPDRHRGVCFRGWTNNGDWWYVCGRCHPSAVDQPATSNHQAAAGSGAGA